MATLVHPDIRYKKSYLEALEEFHANDHRIEQAEMQELPEHLAEHFPEYLARLENEARGQNLIPGRVPSTILWLVEGDTYIGRVSIRHVLNEYLANIGGHIGYAVRPSYRGKGYGNLLLELSLPYAKEIGIERVLITCDADNIYSRKIIERYGGVLENEVPAGEGKPNKLRFWITT